MQECPCHPINIRIGIIQELKIFVLRLKIADIVEIYQRYPND